MSLQIWLPFDGRLDNFGLADIVVTNNGATVDNNGKIGKCYSFDGTDDKIYANNISIPVNSWSLVSWVYPIANSNSSHQYLVGLNTSTSGDFTGVLCWYNNNFGVRTGGVTYEPSGTLSLNNWYHVVATYGNNILKLYVNGQLVKTQESPATPVSASNLYLGVRGGNAGYFRGKLNDVRVYDHCLSTKQVKQISKGLVLHYKLNGLKLPSLETYKNIIPSGNLYNYPTFDTPSANGGWNHWAPSGSSGTLAQNTDKKYIYNKNKTYSHAVSASGSYYLLYQNITHSEEGYRSWHCIVKEENGLPINEDIVRPSLNSRTGGAASGFWTSIVPLGDDFYYCKYEGVIQDVGQGNNALTGLNIRAPYKVYISQIYLHNAETVTPIFDINTRIVDSSGYKHHGVVNGTLDQSYDSPRNNLSIIFSSESHINVTLDINNFASIYTFSWWGKYSNCNSHMMWGFSNGNRLNLYMVNNYFCWNTGDGSNNKFGTINPNDYKDNWHHFVVTGDGTTNKLYIDGQFKANSNTYKAITGTIIYLNGWDSGTGYNFNGQLSDFRIYATALSAEDVLNLYNTPVSISNNNKIMTQGQFKE